MSLASRALRSGILVTGNSLVMKVINLAALVVLARLLTPEDFGAVALALVVVTTSGLFTSAGLGPAVIASDAEPRRAAHHAGVLNLVFATALLAAALSLAGPLASVLGATDMTDVFRWMSLVILFEALAVVPNALLMKALHFGRRAGVELSSTVVQFGLAISLALAGMGVWSLVAGHVVGAGMRWVGFSVLAPRIGWYRAGHWDGALAKGLLRFGATTMLTGLIRHIYTNADRVIIGRLFGTAAVGYYSQSYNVTNIPVQSVSQVTNAVLLPVYTQVRDDHERLAKGYTSTFRFVALLSLPLAVGLFLVAPSLIVSLLGEQWRPSITILQVLAGMALFRPISGTTFSLFLAIKKPNLNLHTALVQAFSMAVVILALHPLGVEGVAAAVSCTFAIGFFFNMWQVARKTPVPVKLLELAWAVLPIVTSCAIMAIGVIGSRHVLGYLGLDLETPVALLVLIVVGVAIYGAAVTTLDRRLVAEAIRLVRTRQESPVEP